MKTIYDLKPAFQGLLRPVVRGLARRGVTANQVTVAAVVLSVFQGAALAAWPDSRWPLLLMPVVLFLRMALNAIDGMLAREHGMKTPLGALLNELGDVVSDVALYLPLALLEGVGPAWIVGIVLVSVMGEMTGVIAVQMGGTRRYDGPLGKSDRAFAFGALALALGLGAVPGAWLDYVLAGLLGLAVVTVLNRARHALRAVS